MDNKREEFLVEMYRQMFNDINRNIGVVWQSVGVLIGAFAILALVEKRVVSPDIAVSIILLICGWMIAHLLDSSYWYNRNLAIIANIERQFLLQSDLRDIHYYFGEHRPGNVMIRQLRIQYALGAGLAALVVMFHLGTRVVPGLGAPMSNFEFERTLPYLTAICSCFYLYWLTGNRDDSYAEFLYNSPGLPLDVSGVKFGVGHGFGSSFFKWAKKSTSGKK